MTTYYVAPPILTTEIGTGTLLNPFRTWSAPMKVLQPGDVLYVTQGTYNETLYITASGSYSGYITIQGDTTSRPLIAPSSGHGVLLNAGVSFVRITGLSATSSELNKSGIFNEGGPAYCHHIVVDNNIVYNNSGSGIQIIQADYIAVLSNVVYGNAKTSAQEGSGISCYQLANIVDQLPVYHCIVAENLCYDNVNNTPATGQTYATDGNGIILDDGDHTQGTFGQIYPPFASASLVCNNICVNNGGSGIRTYLTKNVQNLNNTVWGNQQGVLNANSGELAAEVNSNSYTTFSGNIAQVASPLGYTGTAAAGLEAGNSSTPIVTDDSWTLNNLSALTGVSTKITNSLNFSFDPNNTLGQNPQFANPTRFNSSVVSYATALADFTPTAPGVVTPSSLTSLYPDWLRFALGETTQVGEVVSGFVFDLVKQNYTALLGQEPDFVFNLATMQYNRLIAKGIPLPQVIYLPSVGPNQVQTIGVDFGNFLPAGVVLNGTAPSTLSVTLSALIGTDASPQSRIASGPTIGTISQANGGSGLANTAVLFQVSGCLPNVQYQADVVSHRSDGDTVEAYVRFNCSAP